MRFERIDITNYRQYRSLQIEFPTGKHDLHVIIGDNGTGKTNLLNAFTWCLYGTEPHLGMEDASRGEPKLNKGTMLHALQEGKPNVDIIVSLGLRLSDEYDRVTRTLPVRVVSETEVFEKKADETIVVQRIFDSDDRDPVVLEDEQAANYIGRILDEKIREYFFFDGEQLDSYFNDYRGDVIQKAIYSISQINVLTRMRNRTKTATDGLRRKLAAKIPSADEAERRVRGYEKQAKDTQKEIDELVAKNKRAKAEVKRLDDALRGIPDLQELETKRDELKQKQSDCEEELRRAKKQYVLFARESFIDFAFYEAGVKALNMLARLEDNGELPPAIDKRYLEGMLRDNICKVCGRRLDEHTKDSLVELLNQLTVSSRTSNVLSGMRDSLDELIERVRDYPNRRDEIVHTLDFTRESLRDIEQSLSEITESLSDYNDPEKLKAMYNERDALETQLDLNTKMIGVLESQQKEALAEQEKAKIEFDTIIARQAQQSELNTQVMFGERAWKTLDSIRDEIILESRERMALQTETLFKQLVWKESKCDHIELDEEYQLSLFDNSGFRCERTCSAAERALLALSFTLAMHEVSGFESPLFIDTPIARASGENRANFAETLAKVSLNKQLILTFTPDEYLETISSVFDPIAESNRKLVFNEDEQVVNLRG